jgi:serine/threonine protein kinase
MFEILGKQNDRQLSFIMDDTIKKYALKLMPDCDYVIDKKFSLLSKELRLILKQMLNFNPNERLSARELINNSYFESIRNQS